MLEIVANAKVNLFLEITGKLSNGYHTVDTIMQSVSLSDIVELELLPKNEGINILCSEPGIPTDERNIAFKTAKAYLEASGADCGARINIIKGIPAQAGMGGGSADGAAVLVGLNRLCGDILSTDALKDLASKFGADIPFCVDGGTQRLLGIGTESVESFVSPNLNIVIAKPRAGISTPAAYGLLDSMHNGFVDHKSIVPDELLTALRSPNLISSKFELYNRFEEILESLCNDSLEIIDFMKACGCQALLSGSGTAVFGIADSPKHAQSMAHSISNYFPDCFTYVCETADCGCIY